MKKLYFGLFLLVVLAFLAGVFWNRNNKEIIEITFDTENINYGSEEGLYKIEAKYPLFNSGIPKEVEEKINTEVKNFMVESVEETKREFDELSKDLSEIDSSAKPQYITNFLVKNDIGRLPFININFEIYYYSGGAHGITAIKTFVFDARTGDNIPLQSVFTGEYLRTLSSVSREILKEKDPNGEVYSFAEEGTAPDVANFQSFTLEVDGVHIIFGDYQVGPYVIGHPEIVIPYEKLSEVLRPEIKEILEKN